MIIFCKWFLEKLQYILHRPTRSLRKEPASSAKKARMEAVVEVVRKTTFKDTIQVMDDKGVESEVVQIMSITVWDQMVWEEIHSGFLLIWAHCDLEGAPSLAGKEDVAKVGGGVRGEVISDCPNSSFVYNWYNWNKLPYLCARVCHSFIKGVLVCNIFSLYFSLLCIYKEAKMKTDKRGRTLKPKGPT